MCAPTSIVASANNIASTAGALQTMLLANQVVGLSLVAASITLWVLRVKGVLRLPRLTTVLKGVASVLRK